MKLTIPLLLIWLLLASAPSIAKTAIQPPSAPEQYRYHIVQTLKHSGNTFTQGLSIEGDRLWESSGLYRRSFLQLRSKGSLKAIAEFHYPNRHFAEGIAVYGDYLYGLTWKSGSVYRWHKHDLQLDKRFSIEGEGWGMARWKEHLVTSDGSDILSFRDPKNLKTKHRIAVRSGSRPIYRLNDLSADDIGIWANIWQRHQIVRINPETGNVMGVLTLNKLAEANQQGSFENVLNGVAWDSGTETLWVTGKRWPKMYQLKIQTGQF
ncbi:MAG: glutaminyl-peptide cyclotransferase [Pseudomonadota bacterium]|nr:glutaminyl-peptide cyclotransferase [Pseudomonadota bacterium]